MEPASPYLMGLTIQVYSTLHGPSKPMARSFLMKRRRLQGAHRLMHWLLIKVDACDDWQQMPQLKTDQNPIFQRRT